MSWRLPDRAAVRALRHVLQRRFAADRAVRRGLRIRTQRKRDMLGENGGGRLLVTIFLIPSAILLAAHAAPAAPAGFIGLWWLTLVILRANRIGQSLLEPWVLFTTQVHPISAVQHAKHQLRQITPASVWLGLDLLLLALVSAVSSGHLTFAACAGALLVAIGLSLAATASAWWLAAAGGLRLAQLLALPLVLLIAARFIAHPGNKLGLGPMYDQLMTSFATVLPPAWLARGLLGDPADPLVALTGLVLAVGAALALRHGQQRMIARWRIPEFEPAPSWQFLPDDDSDPAPVTQVAPEPPPVDAGTQQLLPDPAPLAHRTANGRWLLRRLDPMHRVVFHLLAPGGLSFTGRWRVGMVAALVAMLLALPGWPALHWPIIISLVISLLSLPLLGGDFPGLQTRQPGLGPLALLPLGLDRCLGVMARINALRLLLGLAMTPGWIIAIWHGWDGMLGSFGSLSDVAQIVLLSYACMIALAPGMLMLPIMCQSDANGSGIHIRHLTALIAMGFIVLMTIAIAAIITVFATPALAFKILALLTLALTSTLSLLWWRHAWRRGWFDLTVPPR